MAKIQNDLLLRAALQQPVERPPIWLMRQAGRFLHEYRAVREKAGSFTKMVNTPEIAAEVTLQPVDLVGVDAAIIFSDILVIPEAIGLPYQMVEAKGPVFPETIRSEADLNKLHQPDAVSNLNNTYDAIRLTKEQLNGRVPLIGFAGAPWTIFAYMTEGSGSKTFSTAKAFLYKDADFSHALLEKITNATITYLKGQIEAGADIVQVFDSWAGILSPELYNSFSIPYLKRICDAITEVPVIVFAKGAWFSFEELAKLDCQVLGLDWTMDPAWAAKVAPGKSLQGNMDPCQLYAQPEAVKQATLEMLKAFPKGRHIVNLGHGIYPDLPRESVIAMVETVKAFRYA